MVKLVDKMMIVVPLHAVVSGFHCPRRYEPCLYSVVLNGKK